MIPFAHGGIWRIRDPVYWLPCPKLQATSRDHLRTVYNESLFAEYIRSLLTPLLNNVDTV